MATGVNGISKAQDFSAVCINLVQQRRTAKVISQYIQGNGVHIRDSRFIFAIDTIEQNGKVFRRQRMKFITCNDLVTVLVKALGLSKSLLK